MALRLKEYAPVITSGIVVVGGVVAARYAPWFGVAFSVKPDELITKISPLVLAAAFIERAVEVLISPWRDADAAILESKAKLAKTIAEKVVDAAPAVADAAAAGVVPPPAAGAAVVGAAVAVRNAQDTSDDLHEYKGKTRIYAFVASFILGFAVALSGLRTLQQMLASSVDVNHWSGSGSQLVFFRMTDVLLTAALLAGGAAGLHSVVNAFTSFMDNTAKKNS
jgi:hypothetical protein